MFVYAILTTQTLVCLVGRIFVSEKRDYQAVSFLFSSVYKYHSRYPSLRKSSKFSTISQVGS